MTTTSEVAHPAENVLRPSARELSEAWRTIVEANREQEARLRETDPPRDQYAPELTPERRASWHAFVERDLADPTPDYHVLAAMARPDDVWLDVGAGAGRHALFLSPYVREYVTVDPSPGMTSLIDENILARDVTNVRVLDPMPWPPSGPVPVADVCLSVYVYNFVADIAGFLDAMERHASRLCVIQAAQFGTAWQPDGDIFRTLHGEAFIRLPGVRELLAVLGARGTRFAVTDFDFPQNAPQELDSAHQSVRAHYLVREGSEKDRRLRDLLEERFSVGDGLILLPELAGTFEVIVSWKPPVI